MKLIVTVAVLAMAVAHLVFLKDMRYLPIIGMIGAIFVLSRKVFLPTDRPWYLIGGVVTLVGYTYASWYYGDTKSYVYVLFGALNFLWYPVFERIELTNYHLALIFGALGITLMPLGLGKAILTIYDNPNNYCAVVFATLYFGMLLFRNHWWAQLLVFGVMTVLIYLGASRTMLGAVLIFGVLYFLQRWVLYINFRFVFVLGLLVAAFGYQSLITNDQFKLMEIIEANTAVVGSEKKKGLSHRDELFEKSLLLADRQPAGYGLGRSNAALRRAYGTSISPHNMYLKVLLEGGWLALLGFGIIMIGFLLTNCSALAGTFIFAMLIRGLFESATPFTLSLVSGMLIIPMFLHEGSVGRTHRLVFRHPAAAPPA